MKHLLTRGEVMTKIASLSAAKSTLSALGKSDLTKINRKLAKESENALDFLVGVLSDESADKKLKIDVAKFIIDSRIATSKEITKENIGRMMLEVKLNSSQNGFGGNIPDMEPEAEVEFDRVLRVDGVDHIGDDEVVDMTNIGDLRKK